MGKDKKRHDDYDYNPSTLTCYCCMRFDTEECPHFGKVFEETYVETPNNPLSREEKRENWVHCDKYFD